MAELFPVLVVTSVLGLVLAGIAVIVAKFYQKVDQGKALIVNTMKSEPIVTFTGAVVYPVIHRAETMDISVKTIDIDRRGKDGLICKDNIRADISVSFFVRVNKTGEDVLRVAQAIGCARASDPKTLEELFAAKFAEALKTVGKHFNFEDLYKARDDFKDKIIHVIGQDLNGFVLDDAAIDYLEQTPLSQLDADNIMDAEGIRKITELTTAQNVLTNELRQKERMEIGSQNLSADEAVFNFERRRTEAEARKNKEIAVTQAREENEAARVREDEVKRTLLLREKNEEETMIAAEAKQRAVAVAEKGRLRELAVETERVEKARQLEAISREREVELQRIAKERELEVQRREIADVVRARVAVEKSVATEQEQTKDVHALAEANRQKDVTRILAEASAQEALVKEIKAAEASEEAAKFRARERQLVAEAELDASEKLARAKIRLAEGVQAEAAAAGLAEVRVREANAAAIEKQGQAEALVTRERMVAEAVGEEHRGLAMARVKEAEAAAIEKYGAAEAAALREKLRGEAAGLADKASAMKALDGVGREHEEFRLRLERDKAVALETIRVRREVAEAQARVLAEAMRNAKFNIVGGDGAFFERFVQAVSGAQAIDGVVDQSETVRMALRDYLSGDASLMADIKEILARPALSADGVQKLSLSAFLAKLMASADEPTRAKLTSLSSKVAELGIDGVNTH